MTLELYPFQYEGVLQVEKWNGRALLADEQGLGKTVQALSLIKRNPNWSPVVVVCPSGLKYQWQRLAREHVGIDMAILNGTTSDWSKVANQRAVIINPDILKDWVWILQGMKPKLVVADECQAFMNPEAARTWALGELVRNVPYFLPMSGTPIMNRPIEFWSILNMLNPDQWPSRHRFGHTYCSPRRNPFSGGWEFKGCSKPEQLHKLLTDPRSGVMIRRLKKDVLKDLPDKMYNTVSIKLNIKQMREYNLAKNDIKSWAKANYDAKNSAFRAEALQRMNILRQLTAELKTPHVLEWVKTFLESREKLILFGVHRRFVERCHQAFQKESVMVYGGISDLQREERTERFNKRRDCELFIGNSAAYSGWSATDCSHVALGEFPWRPNDVSQMVDRAHGLFRGKQGVATSIWMLIADQTLDVTMVKALKDKEEVVGSVLEGRDWKEKTDSVFDSVLEELINS